MSSTMLLRGVLAATLVLATALVSGCTVRPLMATDPVNGDGPGAALASMSIAPVGTRYGQEVRNHLIFLLNGGENQPADPRYALDLDVTSRTSAAARIQVADDDEPTSEVVTMRAIYRVVDNDTGDVVTQGRREITSAYDVPRQEFAAVRAERDAQDRAARELAELVRLSIGQELARDDVPA